PPVLLAGRPPAPRRLRHRRRGRSRRPAPCWPRYGAALASSAMEFALSPELDALRDEALAVGRAAADRAAAERGAVPDDTWIVGHDRAFAEELGARGWLGMTWPVEHGGGGRSPLERFVVFEALISVG